MVDNEAKAKRTLTAKLRAALPRMVVFRHEQIFVGGTPDISIVDPITTRSLWLEVKFAKPTIKSRGQQDIIVRRLGAAARYVIYRLEKGDARFVQVLRSGQFLAAHGRDWKDLGVWVREFDHDFVIQHVAEYFNDYV